ncbi:PDZ domain-containing protein [Actinomadura sp. GC306]|uniref:S41 family peptidase n=1 Tax=Actinomadura sp. GC306 TaxID=2530367 RepID=UPI00104CF907|nr:S41 family peptidase [Actinomadura sp. GC306]TDC62542.1 PDZ domain-containing protein [Actinomadura sp. GC306]
MLRIVPLPGKRPRRPPDQRGAGRLLRGTAVAVAIAAAYGAGAVTGSGPRQPTAAADGSVLGEAAAQIGRRAAEPVPRGDLDRAAIEGMLGVLDDEWARYYPAHEYDDVAGRLNGDYGGVGLWLGTSGDDGGPVLVASVQPGTAAARAGVRAGDVITGVGGSSVAGWDVERVAEALRGRPEDAVELTVERGRRTVRFHLVRTQVSEGDVTVTDLPEDARLVRVGAFTRGSGQRVRAAVAGEPPRGRPEGGVVLDLRGNPGGLLEEAVETASAFLRSGPVVTYRPRGRRARDLAVTTPGDAKTPLVVLVDAGTASAAEVVAGSLRDRDRAVIIGSRTYGKASVQEAVTLADGSVLELTVGRYRTPGGRNLDGVGIEPDIAVSADRPPPVAERRARAVLRGLRAAQPDE